MKRSTRTNLVLAAIVAALALVVGWQVGSEIDRREPPLGAFDPATIERVGVRCARCVAREFIRRDGDWRMQAPYALDADDALVTRLVAIAASPVRKRHRLADFDLAKIGLAPPLITLELGPHVFEVGMTDALEGDRYVRFDDAIAMVPDRFSPFLMATPESELDRHLLPREGEVVALRIDGVAAPARLAAWRAARATRIETVAADLPLDAGAHEAEVEFADGATIRWRLQRTAEGWRARRATPALDYLLDAALGEALLGSAPAR